MGDLKNTHAKNLVHSQLLSAAVHKKVTLDIHFVSSGRHPDIYNIFIKHGQKSQADLETNRHSKFSAPTYLREIK